DTACRRVASPRLFPYATLFRSGLNGSGWAPKGLAADVLLAEGVRKIEMGTPHAVTVPGAVDAWATLLEAHGRKGLDECLQPAIRDRKSTRLNSSHVKISYAVFC